MIQISLNDFYYMSGSFEGGKNGDCAEVEENTFSNILRPLIYHFVMRVLTSFNDSESATIGPDIGATEITDDFIYLKNWTVKLNDSTDVRRNQLLAVKVFGFLQDAGYEVSGYWGQGFDLKVSLKDFEAVVSDSDVVMSGIDETREQLFA